jgi:hypothetical protein
MSSFRSAVAAADSGASCRKPKLEPEKQGER